MGRPSTYKPEYAAKVLDLGKQGMSECEMARELDVPRSTMRDWADQHADWAAAFDRAKELAQGWWEQQARDNLHKRDFNPTLWMKVVSSRFRADYSEKTILEHTGANGSPLDTANVSERELDRRLRQILAKQDALQPNAVYKPEDADKANEQAAERLN